MKCVRCCVVPYASWHMWGTFPAPLCAMGLHTGSCCGAADWEQCVSVAGKEHLPAGFHGRWVSQAQKASLKKVLAVQREPRQLANCSKVREKYPYTNWQINQSPLGIVQFSKEFSHVMRPFRWICIYPEHSIAEPGLLSEQEITHHAKYFHENCLYSWPDLRVQSGEEQRGGITSLDPLANIFFILQNAQIDSVWKINSL